MISVVIPAYNSAQCIGRAIDSVLAQTFVDYEIIVVDDGSTDNTAEIASQYGNKINYIYQDNGGASAARNTGIKAAQYEWIAFLDSDDEWLPEKLELQMGLLERNQDLVWVGANYFTCLCARSRRAPFHRPGKVETVMSGREYFDNFFSAYTAGTYGYTSTIIVKCHALEKAGLFRVGQLKANDIDMWFRVAYLWPKLGYIRRPLAIYHMDVTESISIKYKHLLYYCDFIDLHLKLAEEHGCMEKFEPCAAVQLQGWIRTLLFSARDEEIRNILSRYSDLFPLYYKVFIRMLTIFPKATAIGCHMISRLIRFLHLRRRVLRPPCPRK